MDSFNSSADYCMDCPRCRHLRSEEPAKLPIIGSKEMCLLDQVNKKWFEKRSLRLDQEGEVYFTEMKRGKLRKFLVSESVMALSIANGLNEHPNGPAASRLFINTKTPADIQKYCLDLIAARK